MSTTRRIETFVAGFSAILLAAAGTVAAVVVPAATGATTVIASNDFENDAWAPWIQSGGPTLSVVPQGTVLQVGNRAESWDGISFSTAVTAGTSYAITARFRLAPGTTGTTSARFTVTDDSSFWTQFASADGVSADGWTTVTGSYTPTASGALKFYTDLTHRGGAAADTFSYLVDDIALTAGATVISAVDFENSTTGAWIQSGGPTLGYVGGGKALQVAGRANSWDTVSLSTPVTAGTPYTLSVKVKLADGTAGTTTAKFTANLGSSYSGFGDAGGITADGWTTVSGSFTPTTSDTYKFYPELAAIDGLANFTFLIDDLTVVSGTTDPGTDPGTDPDFVPGGAINPTTTPVSLAQGTGNVAALTFDDGPNGAATTELLDFLAAKDIRAVFCVIGQNITSGDGASILRRIVADGHVLCNHSTDYAAMDTLTPSQQADKLKANLAIIRTALGDPNAQVPFFRAPNGTWGSTLAATAVSLGMQPLAVVNTINDWATQDQPTLETNLRTAIKPGELVLVHDGGGDRSASIAAVKTVVQERLDDGWQFVLPVGTPARAGVVLSTDFEDGLDGWGPRDGGDGAPSVAITTADVHGGEQAALLSGRVSQGSGMQHTVTGILEPGVAYDFSAWVRFASGQPADTVVLSLKNTAGESTTYTNLISFTTVTNSGWTEIAGSFSMPAQSDAAELYFETRYSGTNTSDLYIDDIVVTKPAPAVVQELLPIKETVDFPVGVAIDSRETNGSPAELVTRHFDQLTNENFMKPEAWYDGSGNFRPNAELAPFMEFAQDEDLDVYGHVLVWHSQTPAWFFQDASGNPLTDSDADQAILAERMRDHIFAVAKSLSDDYGPFGSATNPLTAFDVVNEVVSDGGEYADGLRRSEWYRILGEGYIDLAFEYAESAFNDVYAAPGSDRPVTLFINDYNTEQGGKQARYRALVERLLARDVPLDGVGHQFHVSLAMPVSALAGALGAFADLPVTQAVTELDVTTGTPVTQAALIEQGYYYRDAFRAFRAYADELFSVTVWGLTDGRSWRADAGDPLVFNNALQAKPAYYGIVDGGEGELPARLRVANVFQGDVAIAAGATSAAEWARLPLHTIDGGTAFQLRWEGDHLTAYVTVDDATASGADGVEFAWGGETAAVGRDGTGDVDAIVQDTASGYIVVAELPAEGLAQGGTVPFDVRVTNDLSSVAWNTPGSLGTLTLLESVSFLEAVQASAAPEIDGTIDPVWDEANAVTTAKHVEGTGAEATVRTLWRGGTLYVLALVADPTVDVTGSDPWVQDSVEIYVDPGNVKNGSYRYDDSQIRISAENAVSFGTGDEAFQRGRVQSATELVDGGYLVEAAITIGDASGLGTFHGLDFQVNDAAGGARTGISNWADPSGAGYQSTARWGVGELVGPAGPGEPEGEKVTLGASSVRAGGTLDVSLSGFVPGTVVDLALDRPASALGSGGGGVLGIAAIARSASAAALPTSLGSLTVGSSGAASGSVTIPADTTPGAYRLSASVGGSVLASGQLTVLAAEVAATGVDITVALAVALLLMAAGVGLAMRTSRLRVATRRP